LIHIYQGNGYEGSTIVNYGVSLTVADGKVTVEYNGAMASFEEVLRDGKLTSRDESIQLDAAQLAWLEDSKTWVKHQLEKSR
jgi:hypothetical protein